MLDFIDGAEVSFEPLDLGPFKHGGGANRHYGRACGEALRIKRGATYQSFVTTWGYFALTGRKFLIRDAMDAELQAMGLKPRDYPYAQIVAGRFEPGEGTVPGHGRRVPLDYPCFAHILSTEGFAPALAAEANRVEDLARAVFKEWLGNLGRAQRAEDHSSKPLHFKDHGYTPLLRVCRDTGSIY